MPKESEAHKVSEAAKRVSQFQTESDAEEKWIESMYALMRTLSINYYDLMSMPIPTFMELNKMMQKEKKNQEKESKGKGIKGNKPKKK